MYSASFNVLLVELENNFLEQRATWKTLFSELFDRNNLAIFNPPKIYT